MPISEERHRCKPAFTSAPHAAPILGLSAALDNIQNCYNPNRICPLSPFENRLNVPIGAGEKMFPGGVHE
jgi:hypothetical protein